MWEAGEQQACVTGVSCRAAGGRAWGWLRPWSDLSPHTQLFSWPLSREGQPQPGLAKGQGGIKS